ncbi:MAG: hypothetical protein JNM18_07795, partial [Planctomycetaceae bacterium]|nr:hypothetical protein [Planctomycetaceae bacterium]
PIVTLPGEFMRGRVTKALYEKLGVTDCVARDLDDYVRIAVRLGTEPEFRKRISEAILAGQHLVYEQQGFIRELEQFLTAKVAETSAA